MSSRDSPFATEELDVLATIIDFAPSRYTAVSKGRRIGVEDSGKRTVISMSDIRMKYALSPQAKGKIDSLIDGSRIGW